ncbi:MAG: hypothetical protein IT437_07495 [Phycisphaerales bacterium]|nr:hypothetical protein [Phycisphaerales bacterium]
MIAAAGHHQTRPFDRFYWCVLDAPGWSRTGALPPGLRQRLDEELPVPSAELHAVGTPLPGGGLLVCAARRDGLAGVNALSLTPECLPEFAGSADRSRLNLLVGEFQPVPVRRARRRMAALATAAVIACTALLSAGFLRRAAAWNAAADVLAARANALLPEGGEPALNEHLDAARAATGSAATGNPPPDSALAFAAVLAGWPSAAGVAAQAISVDGTGASLSATIEGDPEFFLSALHPPPGWRRDEPRLVGLGGVTRVTLKLRPEGP